MNKTHNLIRIIVNIPFVRFLLGFVVCSHTIINGWAVSVTYRVAALIIKSYYHYCYCYHLACNRLPTRHNSSQAIFNQKHSLNKEFHSPAAAAPPHRIPSNDEFVCSKLWRDDFSRKMNEHTHTHASYDVRSKRMCDGICQKTMKRQQR